jgi:hypothetical protein
MSVRGIFIGEKQKRRFIMSKLTVTPYNAGIIADRVALKLIGEGFAERAVKGELSEEEWGKVIEDLKKEADKEFGVNFGEDFLTDDQMKSAFGKLIEDTQRYGVEEIPEASFKRFLRGLLKLRLASVLSIPEEKLPEVLADPDRREEAMSRAGDVLRLYTSALAELSPVMGEEGTQTLVSVVMSGKKNPDVEDVVRKEIYHAFANRVGDYLLHRFKVSDVERVPEHTILSSIENYTDLDDLFHDKKDFVEHLKNRFGGDTPLWKVAVAGTDYKNTYDSSPFVVRSIVNTLRFNLLDKGEIYLDDGSALTLEPNGTVKEWTPEQVKEAKIGREKEKNDVPSIDL